MDQYSLLHTVLFLLYIKLCSSVIGSHDFSKHCYAFLLLRPSAQSRRRLPFRQEGRKNMKLNKRKKKTTLLVMPFAFICIRSCCLGGIAVSMIASHPQVWGMWAEFACCFGSFLWVLWFSCCFRGIPLRTLVLPLLCECVFGTLVLPLL